MLFQITLVSLLYLLPFYFYNPLKLCVLCKILLFFGNFTINFLISLLVLYKQGLSLVNFIASILLFIHITKVSPRLVSDHILTFPHPVFLPRRYTYLFKILLNGSHIPLLRHKTVSKQRRMIDTHKISENNFVRIVQRFDLWLRKIPGSLK